MRARAQRGDCLSRQLLYQLGCLEQGTYADRWSRSERNRLPSLKVPKPPNLIVPRPTWKRRSIPYLPPSAERRGPFAKLCDGSKTKD